MAHAIPLTQGYEVTPALIALLTPRLEVKDLHACMPLHLAILNGAGTGMPEMPCAWLRTDTPTSQSAALLANGVDAKHLHRTAQPPPCTAPSNIP